MKKLVASIIGLLVMLPSQALAHDREEGPPDNSLDLAAAYALEGMYPEARTLLDSIPEEWRKPPKGSNGQPVEKAKRECRAQQWAFLDHFLRVSSEDPFDLLVGMLNGHDWGGGNTDPIGTLVWQRLFARFAQRAHYGAMSDYVLQSGRDYFHYRLKRNEFDSDLERQAAAAQLNAIEQEIRMAATSALTGKPVPVDTTPADEAALHLLLMRLLQLPRLTPFREVQLAPKFQSLELSEEEEEARAKKALADFSFPEGFDPVRAERQGDEAVAIGLSQDYDPIGEISRGAYWVLRSHDGGRTWGVPLYTGLRIQQPYVVRSVSNAPLLAEDHLQVEVKIQELDESSITFPPVALRAKREQSGLLLEIPFTELEKDSDGDGLTDLAEERLILDPLNPDTDGDGVGDGWDQLPQVAWTQEADEPMRALAAVLSYITYGKSPAIIHEIAGPNVNLDDFMGHAKRASLTDERTSFIVAQRVSFRGLLPSERTIVLTEDELDLAQKKFGPMFPSRISLIVLDREHRRGYVIWDASWRGGVLNLERQGDGTWRVRPGSEWIT